MTAKGHMLLASAAAISLDTFLPVDNFMQFYPLVIFGSVLPDIDESESYIGRKFRTLSEIVSFVLPHRTLTHYLFLPIIIAIIAYYLNSIYLFGLAFGIFMHDIGDMLTKGGIKGFFFPFFINKKIALLPYPLRFYTNSLTEHILILILAMSHIFLLNNQFARFF